MQRRLSKLQCARKVSLRNTASVRAHDMKVCSAGNARSKASLQLLFTITEPEAKEEAGALIYQWQSMGNYLAVAGYAFVINIVQSLQFSTDNIMRIFDRHGDIFDEVPVTGYA